MTTAPQQIPPPGTPPLTSSAAPHRWSIFDYFWFVAKNVIGWIFILGSLPVGLTVPGPGGVPMFLIGFALVSFPGKRKLTTRVMRGRPVTVDPGLFILVVTVLAICATVIVIALIATKYEHVLDEMHAAFLGIFGIAAIAAGVTWLTMLMLVSLTNWALRRMPRVRRFFRPLLRRWGVVLLPPRARTSIDGGMAVADKGGEILQFSERYPAGFKATWKFLQPWLKRLGGMTITVLIFIWILKPVTRDWPQVREHVLQTNKLHFAIAAGLFALFLFAFRAMAWRRILRGLGYPVPVGPATRVWATSELARYVPGSVLQFVGRVYLIRPYGVSGSICSTSQIIELVCFLFANILVAVTCLTYLFWRNHLNGRAKIWLVIVIALIPLLLWLLNPRVFYPLINRVMARLKKPPIVTKLRRRDLTGLITWNIFGLLLQSVAVFLITHDLLHMQWQKWWVVAGSYCLAWCAGFLAFWAPGGFGVRELVFITAMQFAIPRPVREQFTSTESLAGILAVLAVLLRLWTIAGELLVSSIAYLVDLRGALGKADAPGRI